MDFSINSTLCAKSTVVTLDLVLPSSITILICYLSNKQESKSTSQMAPVHRSKTFCNGKLKTRHVQRLLYEKSYLSVMPVGNIPMMAAAMLFE